MVVIGPPDDDGEIDGAGSVALACVVYRHTGVIGMLRKKRKQPEATAICRVPYIHVCCLCFCWRFCCITAERTMGDSLARRPPPSLVTEDRRGSCSNLAGLPYRTPLDTCFPRTIAGLFPFDPVRPPLLLLLLLLRGLIAFEIIPPNEDLRPKI